MVYRRTERSERVREASRKKILDAAALLFSKQGFESTTVQQIVSEADTSTGSLYFHFANKDALLTSLVTETQLRLWQAADRAASQVPPGAGRLAVSTYVQVASILNQADMARVVLLSAAHAGLTSSAFAAQSERLRHLLTENRLAPADDDLELIIAAWIGAIRAVLERHLTNPEGRDPKTIGRFVTRWNLRSLGLRRAEVEKALGAIDDLEARTAEPAGETKLAQKKS